MVKQSFQILVLWLAVFIIFNLIFLLILYTFSQLVNPNEMIYSFYLGLSCSKNL